MPTRGASTVAARSRKKAVQPIRSGPKRRGGVKAKVRKNNNHFGLGISKAQTMAKKLIHDRPVSSILMAAGAGLIVESLNGIKKLISEGNQKTTELTRKLLGKK